MKTLLIVITSFLLIGNALAKNAEEIFQDHKTSILRMGFLDSKGKFYSIGTGFFIDSNGATNIITNKHVIDGLESIKRKYASLGLVIAAESINKNRYINLKVLGTHKYADVGLIQIEKMQGGDTTLQISERDPNTGENVFLIGNPRDMYFSITSGILSRKYNDDLISNNKSVKVLRYQFTASSLPGSSGSPILNEDGDVIGILSHGRVENIIIYSIRQKGFVENKAMFSRIQGFTTGYAAKYLVEFENYNWRNSNIAKTEYPNRKLTITQIPMNVPINEKETSSSYNLDKFPFPKELNMRMYSVSGGVYEYVGKSADGHDVQIRYSKKAGTDAQFSDWNKVNAFVASENRSLGKNGKVETYPITDSGVFHVKSTVTMKDGQKVKYLRIFPGNDMRFDVMVYSKDGNFDKINIVVEKFMNKLRGNKAFSHLYKGKRNISNI